MIKKMGSLTYNELIKQFKKPSLKVILAFMLVIAILLPLGIKLISTNDTYDINRQNFFVENAKSNVDSLKNDKTEAGKIKLGMAQVELDYCEMVVNNKSDFNDWKSKELEIYRQNSVKIFVIKEILNGTSKDLIEKNIFNINNEDIEKYASLSKEELNKNLNELNKENEEIKNIVVNGEYLKHLDKEIKNKEEFIKQEDKRIEELEKSLKQDSKNENLNTELIREKNNKILSEKLLEIDRYRYDNKINFELENWKNKTLIDMERLHQELTMDMLTEDQYQRESSMNSSRLSYNEYQEVFRDNQKAMKEKIDRDWYSLKNDLPQLEFVKDARSVVNDTFEIFVILTVLVIIIIAGGTVSSEFSKGTIRLLLIRPVARWKILLSKLLATLIIAYGILILSVGVLAIASGVTFGFDALKTAVVQTIGVNAVGISYIQYILPKILVSSASLIFIISLAFMISTLVKNTALAVSISTIVYLGAMPLTIMLVAINMRWITDTLIPYINQSMFNLVPSFMEMLKLQNGVTMNTNFGAIQLLIVSLIMLVITFLIFSKKDIKN